MTSVGLRWVTVHGCLAGLVPLNSPLLAVGGTRMSVAECIQASGRSLAHSVKVHSVQVIRPALTVRTEHLRHPGTPHSPNYLVLGRTGRSD